MDGRLRDQKFEPLGCTAFACVCTFRRTSFAASLVIELIVTCLFYLSFRVESDKVRLKYGSLQLLKSLRIENVSVIMQWYEILVLVRVK